MHILLLIYSLVIISLFVLPHSYTNELLISFLPYHGFILFFLLLLSCLFHKKVKYRATSLLCIAIGTVTTGYTNYQWISFYENIDFSTQPEFVETDEDVGLTYFFANILKTNTDYEGIQATIAQLDPDVVLLTEYKQHHHDNLKDFFAQEYKYINRIVGVQDVVGNVIFSKYPLEDFAPKVYQEARRYGYVAVNYEEENYYFYHLHTSAPISEKFWLNREEQLAKFTNSFIEQDQKRLPSDRVVLIGDFNVAPRSPNFKDFNKKIEKNMVHFSKFTPAITTWGFGLIDHQPYALSQNLIRSHIDHMWTNKQTTLYDIQIIEVPGSDHRGIYARVK